MEKAACFSLFTIYYLLESMSGPMANRALSCGLAVCSNAGGL